MYFPRQGFGDCSILLFIDVFPLFPRFSEPSFPDNSSAPFCPRAGEPAGFVGHQGVILGGAGARVGGLSIHPHISPPRRELLREDEGVWGVLIAHRRFIQGMLRRGRGPGRGRRDGVLRDNRAGTIWKGFLWEERGPRGMGEGCHDNLWGFPRKPGLPWQLHHSSPNW